MEVTYMSEDKISLIDLVPDSVDNAVKNITDKPTQNMGTTLADIWYLVFGGISQAAEKRKLKYSYALQQFENELQEKISKIPKDKRVEPDIQIVAKALEESKYCVEKETFRNMFSTLITSSMNIDFNNKVHPSYIEILKHMSDFDAKLLVMIYQKNTSSFTNLIENNINDLYNFINHLSSSFRNLENLGLIRSNMDNKIYTDENLFDYDPLFEIIRDVLYFDSKHICNKLVEYYNTTESLYITYNAHSPYYFKIMQKAESLKQNLFFVNMTSIGKNFMSCCFENK